LRVLMEEGDDQFRDQSAECRVGNGAARAVELVDVDGLRGLDLSLDSSGPHRIVKSEQRKVKSEKRDAIGQRIVDCGISYRLTGIRSLMEEIDLAVGDRAGKKSGKFVVADRLQPYVVRETVDYCKLGSMRGWFGERGARDKRQGASYLRADRDEVERIGRCGLLRLEPCKEWGGRYYGSRRFPVSYKGGELHRSEKSGWILRLDWLSIDTPDMPWATNADCVPFAARTASGGLSRMVAPGLHFPAPVPMYRHYLMDKPQESEKLEAESEKCGKGQVERRVRVLVHAVELVTPVWDRVNERFGAPYQRIAHSGFATPWVVGKAGSWEEEYAVNCEGLQLKGPCEDPEGSGHGGSGVYVVFTAVEVAEKRGRHWVRLPWCSKLRIQEVVFAGNEEATEEIAEHVNGERSGGARSDMVMTIPGCTWEPCREKMAESTLAVVRNRAGP
jgi:hypothetical protein